MANLRRLTLERNPDTARWDLRHQRTHHFVTSFDTKRDATRGGALRRVLGEKGASVVIHDRRGRFQEERTYPRSRDPRSSRG